ncbi:MAG: DNA alkylation repair protein [Bacteroidia bacterium]|nr:DNA alkylation repair protein [Bacteroidia bacterium]
MTYKEVMSTLESMGNPNTKKILMKHGAKEPFWGVKVGDMKKIQKKIKKDHELSLQLYKSGNGDAMYFAGLIADENQITKEHLRQWAKEAKWHMISEYTVPWLAADAGYGEELGLEWIESGEENVASAGWSALANHILITPNEELDVAQYEKLLMRVEKEIHGVSNRVRYTMNGYVIALGSALPELTEKAIAAGERIGKVNVDMGGTACKVPSSPKYIRKIEKMGRLGKKKKMARC